MEWKRLRAKVRNPEMRKVLDMLVSGETPINTAIPSLDEAPIIGVASTVTIEASELAVMNVDDTIVFEGKTFTRKASTAAADLEFEDATGLIACINHTNGHDDVWTASDSGGDVLITSDTAGAGFNGKIATTKIEEDTTANGAVAVKASANIPAATLTELANGDVITFAGMSMKKVASGASVANLTWTTTANLISVIDSHTNWDAEDDLAAGVDIEAAVVGADFNGYDVMVYMYRTTADGVNATTGYKGQMYLHDGDTYLALDDIGTDNTDIAKWDVVDTTAHE